MKNRTWCMLVALSICSLCLGSTVFCGEAKEVNLLTNPGFEKSVTDKDGKQQPTNWEVANEFAPGTAETISDSAKTHSGAQCLLLTPKNPGKQEAHIYQVVPASISSNEKYVFKVWVRVDKDVLDKMGYTPRIKQVIYQYKTDMQYLGGVDNGYRGLTDKWQEFSWEYTPKNKDIAKIGCALVAVDGPVYFDDAFFGVKVEDSK